MANVPVVIMFGSSNMGGFLADLLDLPGDDFTRIFGPYAPGQPGHPIVLPVNYPLQGIRVWQARVPYGVNLSRTITGGADTTHINVGTAITVVRGQWVFIQANSAGGMQGITRMVNADSAGTTITVTPAMPSAPAADGTLIVFTGARSTASVSADGLTVTKSFAGVNDFDASVVGRAVLLPAMLNGPQIRVIVSRTATTIVLDDAMPPPYTTSNDPIYILDGPNVAESIATISQGAALMDLAYRLNNSPVYLDGFDYNNWKSQHLQLDIVHDPGYRPVALDPWVNSLVELSWHLRAHFEDPIHVLHMGVNSARMAKFPIGTNHRGGSFSWFHTLTSLDFHPMSSGGLWDALTGAITSMFDLIEGEGNKPMLVGIFNLLSENDLLDASGVTSALIGEHQALIRDSLREFVAPRIVQFGSNQKVPYITAGPSTKLYASGNAERFEDAYAQLQKLQDEDAYTAHFRMDDAEFGSDNAHLTAEWQFILGQRFFAVWKQVALAEHATDVDICNMALSHIGESAKVTAIDGTDTSAQARHCANFYPKVIRRLQEMHPWGFASRSIAGTISANTSGTATNTRDDWLYSYDIPENALKVFWVGPEGAAADAESEPFEEASDWGGKHVYTNVADARIRYSVHVTNTLLFSASFAAAAALLLASDLAGPIIKGTEGTKAKVECLSLLKNFFLAEARTHDANQRKVTAEQEAPWMPGGSGMVTPRDGWLTGG